jgi:hypothetical protein
VISGLDEELRRFMQSHRATFEGLRGIMLELVWGEGAFSVGSNQQWSVN